MHKHYKYIHICPNIIFNHQFALQFNAYFNKCDHLFIFYGSSNHPLANCIEFNVENNIYFTDQNTVDILALYYNNCEKIFLHGLFNHSVNNFVVSNKHLLKKCYWIAWGFALYYDQENEDAENDKKYLNIKEIAKNSAAIISTFSIELSLIKAKFKTKGSLICTLTYNTFEVEQKLDCTPKDTSRKHIIIGHAAGKDCNQIRALKNIPFIKNSDIKIYCPLVYGPQKNINDTIKFGKEIFGAKFIPITKSLPVDEYNKFLVKMDIAIYDLKRQRAGANILRMLSLGKKVYISDSISTYQSLKIYGFKLYPIKNKNSYVDVLEPIPIKDAKHNHRLAIKYFSRDTFFKGWESILNIKAKNV